MFRKSLFLRSKALQLGKSPSHRKGDVSSSCYLPQYVNFNRFEDSCHTERYRESAYQAACFSSIPSVPTYEMNIDEVTSLEQSSLYFRLASKVTEAKKSEETKIETNVQNIDSDRMNALALSRALTGRLEYAMSKHDYNEILRLFKKSEEYFDTYSLRPDTILKIFNILCYHSSNGASISLSDLYSVYCRYRVLYDERDLPLDPKVTKTLVFAIAKAETDSKTLNKVISETYKFAIQQDSEFQREVLPTMLVTLAMIPGNSVRTQALSILTLIQKNNIEVNNNHFSKILDASSGSNFRNVPRHVILELMIERGQRPRSPKSVLTILSDNYYNQFKSIGILSSLIKSITYLVQNPSKKELPNAYLLSEALLEELMMSGTRARQSSFVLSVWDLMELLGYQPSESMYESVILAFCKSDKQDHLAFAAMTEMEDRGIRPSRTFMRAISDELRTTRRRLDHAYNMLIRTSPNGVKLSTPILNCLLAACAQEGLVDRSFAIFDQFVALDLQPDQESFSFLMEGLAKEISKMCPVLIIDKSSQEMCVTDPTLPYIEDMHIYLESIDAINNMMNEKGFIPDRYFTNHHIICLILLQEFGKAFEILEEAVKTDRVILTGTYEQFVLQCAHKGEKDLTLRILSFMTDESGYQIPSYLNQVIESTLEKFESS